MSTHSFFATTSKGLEETLAQELRDLGATEIVPAHGGVAFRGTLRIGYRANILLRTAHRVLLTVAVFPCPTPFALYDETKKVAWPELFDVSCTLVVSAATRDSAITNSVFAAQKVKDAVVDRFRDACGTRPSVDLKEPDVRIHLRIHRDRATVSLDLSGDSLNIRGYRTDRQEAPVRETLAAGIVLMSGYDGTQPLRDPACGGGTLLIEAALIATNTAPGLLRDDFALTRLAFFDGRLWKEERAAARALITSSSGIAPIAGSDLSGAAIRSARLHADSAGIGGVISFRTGDIASFDPGRGPGIILCNPPYGVRLGNVAEVEALYKTMGRVFKEKCDGWTAWILSGNPGATKSLGMKATQKIPVFNGPIDARLLKYEIRGFSKSDAAPKPAPEGG